MKVLLVAAALFALGTAIALQLIAARSQTVLSDPRRDPGARRVTPHQREALSTFLLADPSRADPFARIEKGIALCAVDRHVYWREGLRALFPLLDVLPDDIEGRSLRALVAARLGEIPKASALVSALPADHWRSCLVRAILYESARDNERAESALVAALQLAPPERAVELSETLEALQQRTGRIPSTHQRLWDRPPTPLTSRRRRTG